MAPPPIMIGRLFSTGKLTRNLSSRPRNSEQWRCRIWPYNFLDLNPRDMCTVTTLSLSSMSSSSSPLATMKGNKCREVPKIDDGINFPHFKLGSILGWKIWRKRDWDFLTQEHWSYVRLWRYIRTWTSQMRRMFRKGIAHWKSHEDATALMKRRAQMPQNIPTFDEEILGGNVDFDKFS